MVTLTLKRVPRDLGDLYEYCDPIIASWTGVANSGVPLTQTQVNDASLYAGDFENLDTTGSPTRKSLRAVAGSNSIVVNGSGVTLAGTVSAGAVSFGAVTCTTLHATSTSALDGSIVSLGTMTCLQYGSNVATGTPPYSCTSTTLNTNLNADMTDGKHAGTSAGDLAFYDGSGRVVDAQKLDGIDSTSFARVDTATNFTTVPTIESDAIAKIFVGTYTGNGTASKAVTGVGFSPRIVFIEDPVGLTSGWFNVGNQAITPTSGAATSNASTNLDSDGFTINSTVLNVNTRTYYYVAIG